MFRKLTIAVLLAACKRDAMESFAERTCACTTPECSDAVSAELDAWLREPRSGTRDRDHDIAQLERLQACARRFEGARRAGISKVTLPPTPAGERITIGRLSIPTPAGFHATGNRFIADGPIEWVFSAPEPAAGALDWLDKGWSLAATQYQKVKAEPPVTLMGGPGWTIAARTATGEDRYGHPLFFMVIAAHRTDTGLVFPSDVEGPAPIDAAALAAIRAEIPRLEVVGE
jgi:hypothetical protein